MFIDTKNNILFSEKFKQIKIKNFCRFCRSNKYFLASLPQLCFCFVFYFKCVLILKHSIIKACFIMLHYIFLIIECNI